MKYCALKSMNYYEFCYNCDARKRHVCYITKEDLEKHLEEFNQLFNESQLHILERQVLTTKANNIL